MTRASTKWLAIVAVVLLVGVVLVNTAGDDYSAPDTGLLLPDLKESLNDVSEIAITSGEESTTIRRDGDRWLVASNDGYPADTGKLREGLLALADAGKMEAKTSNPERHERLGLAGDDATRVALSGDGVDITVILGGTAQQSYRYARLDGDDQSWLIDANPALPADPGEWLVADLVDIESADIASVTIEHADGETISVSRDEDDSLVADNLPEGRELSYATVLDPLAGVLNGLRLEDVRTADDLDAEADVTTVYRTSDGLVVTARRYPDGDDNWFGLAAQATEGGETAEAADTGDPVDDSAAVEDSATEAEASSEAADPVATPAERAAEINATVEGWMFRLPDYKANQVARRWDDLLKEPEAASDEE